MAYDIPLYWGLFVVPDERLDGEHSRWIKNQHATFGFDMMPPDDIPWGDEVSVEVIGYGNDGINEGYQVEIPEEWQWCYEGADIPHITVSVDRRSNTADTAHIDFQPLDEPFLITCRWGYHADGHICYC